MVTLLNRKVPPSTSTPRYRTFTLPVRYLTPDNTLDIPGPSLFTPLYIIMDISQPTAIEILLRKWLEEYMKSIREDVEKKVKKWIYTCLIFFMTISCGCGYGYGNRSFTEWPDGRRPPCTTMPWSIWPALVVLWGVCWMFYTPPPSQDWEDKLSKWAGNDSDFDFDLSFPIDDTSSSLGYESLLQPGDLTLTDHFNDYSSEEAGLVLALPMSQALIEEGYQTLGVHSILGEPEEAGSEIGPGPSGVATPSFLAQHKNEGNIRVNPDSAKRSTKFVCSYPDCIDQSFNRQCDLKRHTERKHDRPHKCTVQGCNSEGFGTNIDLDRHMKTIHQQHNMFCPASGCPRAENALVQKSFHRQDNLDDHIRRRHPGLTTNNAHATPQNHLIAQQRATESTEKHSQVPLPQPLAKRRRLGSSTDDEEDHQAKRIKQLEMALEESRRDKEELRVDKRELKEELKAAKERITELENKLRK